MNLLFLKTCLCLYLINIVNAQTAPESCLRTDNEDYFCESPGYPKSYKKVECVCEFSVPDGFQIVVLIQDMDLDSSTQDYVAITGGSDDKIYKYSWFLNQSTQQPTSFLIDQSKVSINFHADKDSDVEKRGFKILLKQYGELTTTEKVTTESILPTPVANDSIYHTIYLDTSPSTFKKEENKFKDFMINITERYVTKHNMEIIEDITANNIRIQYAKQCSVQWPNSEHCTEIMYAIPIVLLNSTKYELSAKNLLKMWTELGSKHLEELTTWDEYKKPNNNYSMFLWLGLSLIILLAFLTFLFFMKVFSLRLSTHFKRRLSDTQEIMANSNRNSDASLWPMSSQIVPPLFDNESPYVYYEPDPVQNSVNNSQIPATKTMMNIDDMSDDEILTVPNWSGNNNVNSNQKPILKFDLSTNKESVL